MEKGWGSEREWGWRKKGIPAADRLEVSSPALPQEPESTAYVQIDSSPYSAKLGSQVRLILHHMKTR